jgi:hypothetical protein
MGQAQYKKKKERAERIRIQKHKESINNLYPSFNFVNDHIVDKKLVDLVKDSIKKIDFEKLLKEVPVDVRINFEFLKEFQKYNFIFAFKDLTNKILNGNPEMAKKYGNGFVDVEANKIIYSILLYVGEAIFENNKDTIKNFWPDQGFRLVYSNNAITVVFQRLIRKQNGDGRVIYSHLVPKKVVHQRKEYNIYFTLHSIKRIIERFTDNSELTGQFTYTNYAGVYEFFIYSRTKIIKSQKYDRNTNDAEPFIQFYYPMILDIYFMNNLQDVIVNDIKNFSGENPFEQGISSVKEKLMYTTCIGSPCVFNSETNGVIAITGLVPGFFPTPENAILTKKKVTSKLLQEKLRHFFYGKVHMKSKDYMEALQFFHLNGCQQFFIDEPPCKVKLFISPQFYEFQSEIPEFLPVFQRV